MVRLGLHPGRAGRCSSSSANFSAWCRRPSLACFVPALGDRTATLKGSAILAAGVTFFGVLLFSYVLKIPFPMFRLGH